MSRDRAFAFLDETADRRLAELFDLLRIPSVSTLPERAADVRRAAEWVRAACERAGLRASLHETAGHPIVFAESDPRPGLPTVLAYGHYDVQPADPLDLWKTGPFEPAVRDDNIYARGSTDDKGQMFTWIKAVEAWQRGAGGLPVNVKLLIEGEEEIGSRHLDDWIGANRERLRADCVAISDSDQFAPGMPALTYGLRGLAYYEVRVYGPAVDLHSGQFGGAVKNPAQALAEIIAGLRDPRTERVLVDGFYDRVRALEPWERDMFRSLPHDDAQYREELAVPELRGEEGFTTLERTWARPTCEVNGIFGGFMGSGAKTVLPAWAGAKISMRLVPDQRAAEIAAAFERTVRRLAPKGVRVDVAPAEAFIGVKAGDPPRVASAQPTVPRISAASTGSDPVIVERETPWAQAAAAALEAGFGAKPVFIRSGGSIPVVLTFKKQLGIDSVLMGYGLPDDAAHSPNEKFHLPDFHRGCKASAAFLGEVAARAKK
jgi:acetylornithine deacetylase/succinyl-diaminopimelate desuccinylase-like protein